jgi:Uma2 family endonuclease
MAIATRKITSDEYTRLPETTRRVELINGEMIQMPSPELNRQDAILDLGIFFRRLSCQPK